MSKEFQNWLCDEMGLEPLDRNTLQTIFVPQLAPVWSTLCRTMVNPRKYEKFKSVYFGGSNRKRDSAVQTAIVTYSAVDKELGQVDEIELHDCLAIGQLPIRFHGPPETYQMNLLLKRIILRSSNEFLKLHQALLQQLKDHQQELSIISTRISGVSTTKSVLDEDIRMERVDQLDLSRELNQIRQIIVQSYQKITELTEQYEQLCSEKKSDSALNGTNDETLRQIRAEIRGWESAMEVLQSEMSLMIVQKQRANSPTVFETETRDHCQAVEHLQHSLNKYHWTMESIKAEYNQICELRKLMDAMEFVDIRGNLDKELSALEKTNFCKLEESEKTAVRAADLAKYKWTHHGSYQEIKRLLELPFFTSFETLVPAVRILKDKRKSILRSLSDALAESSQTTKDYDDILNELEKLSSVYRGEIEKIRNSLRVTGNAVPEIISEMREILDKAYVLRLFP